MVTLDNARRVGFIGALLAFLVLAIVLLVVAHARTRVTADTALWTIGIAGTVVDAAQHGIVTVEHTRRISSTLV